MPELPEVETVIRTLEHQLQHPTIKEIYVNYDKIIDMSDKKQFMEIIKHKTIHNYSRLGKYLIFDLGDYVWITHLRMEGKFFVQNKDEEYDRKHTHIRFLLDDGRELRYHDTRKFGRMYVYPKIDNMESYPCFMHVGLDLFDPNLTGTYIYQRAHHRSITLKQLLLDQKTMAGIGNIYADEICFACQLHPETIVSHLLKKDYEKIVVEARRILAGAIKAGGTTIRSYSSSLGVDGRFQLELKVHGRKDKACFVCGTTIQKTFVATRGTYFCQTCQKRR